MKEFLLIIAALLIGAGVCYAKVIKEDNKFKVESSSNKGEPIMTDYIWETKDGKEYNIYVTLKGVFFINKISSKTNKPYKYYLSKEAQSKLKEQLLKDNDSKYSEITFN